MSIWRWIQQSIVALWNGILSIIKFVSRGVTRIFAPNEETYPATGVQPYEGTPNKE
jgi:hypothetical protein